MKEAEGASEREGGILIITATRWASETREGGRVKKYITRVSRSDSKKKGKNECDNDKNVVCKRTQTCSHLHG